MSIPRTRIEARLFDRRDAAMTNPPLIAILEETFAAELRTLGGLDFDHGLKRAQTGRDLNATEQASRRRTADRLERQAARKASYPS
ncbi:hypothetical protein [Thetidibacter halocola]|uniref:Uncharacterized protein n=1 Tax=Thetidibacter halocola TaxID=2827239 RepID=A0A8J7WE51_9RHOB|nr:hypothetical protein [Thetidibacter halocola]MBS0125945.1 hypothetical protein [Thetidibacter halocola]